MGVKIFDKEYQEACYPAAACLIDAIRGTMCVDTAEEIFEALNLITEAESFKFCRIKNKYQRDVPFNNLMINVMFEYFGVTMVGEIQITTFRSLNLKTLQHKFYDILRCFGEEEAKKIAETGVIDPKVAADVYQTILESVVNK